MHGILSHLLVITLCLATGCAQESGEFQDLQLRSWKSFPKRTNTGSSIRFNCPSCKRESSEFSDGFGCLVMVNNPRFDLLDSHLRPGDAASLQCSETWPRVETWWTMIDHEKMNEHDTMLIPSSWVLGGCYSPHGVVLLKPFQHRTLGWLRISVDVCPLPLPLYEVETICFLSGRCLQQGWCSHLVNKHEMPWQHKGGRSCYVRAPRTVLIMFCFLLPPCISRQDCPNVRISKSKTAKTVLYLLHSVDGEGPAPPWMYETSKNIR